MGDLLYCTKLKQRERKGGQEGNVLGPCSVETAAKLKCPCLC